jgi:hypothetical protein
MTTESLNAPDRKTEFTKQLKTFAQTLRDQISSEDGQWTVKGFIDVFQNIVPDGRGGVKKIANLRDFVLYRRGDPSLIVPRRMGAA